jgi:hypothetical protein
LSLKDQYDGFDAGIILQKGTDLVYRPGSMLVKTEVLVGGWAEVYRKDWKRPIRAEVALAEYIRYKRDGSLMPNWKNMPATMIRKVALVQALREAFPEDLQGMYSQEEMPIDDSSLETKTIEVTQEPKWARKQTTTTVQTDKQAPATNHTQTTTQKPEANQPETKEAKLGVIPQPQIAAYYARLTKIGASPKMGEMIAHTILPRDAFHEDNTISWSKVSEEDFKRLCDVYESDKWETILQAIFNRYTAKSGATPDIAGLIVEDILHGKKCLDIQTGKPMWSYVSKEDFEVLWNTFRGDNWQKYFSKMNGEATDLRDVV